MEFYGLGSDHIPPNHPPFIIIFLAISLSLSLSPILSLSYSLSSLSLSLVNYENSGHHHMSGIYNTGLFVGAFRTGSSDLVLVFFCQYNLDELWLTLI